jgi:hypothetical protein
MPSVVMWAIGRKKGVHRRGRSEHLLMEQLKGHEHLNAPPAMATSGKGNYRKTRVEIWRQLPEYSGRGRLSTWKQAQSGWQYLKVVKRRSDCWLTGSGSTWSFEGCFAFQLHTPSYRTIFSPVSATSPLANRP